MTNEAGDTGGDLELARLEQLLAKALRLALLRHWDGAADGIPMRSVLAEACGIAKARQLYPEQVIVMLKGAWTRLDESGFVRRQDAQAALDGAVSACIDQYFSEMPRGARPAHRPTS